MEFYHFKLYVAGESPNGMTALKNLRDFCQRLLPHSHKIEVIDVLQEPQRGLSDGVLVTPTLVRATPTPKQQLVGALSEEKKFNMLITHEGTNQPRE